MWRHGQYVFISIPQKKKKGIFEGACYTSSLKKKKKKQKGICPEFFFSQRRAGPNVESLSSQGEVAQTSGGMV